LISVREKPVSEQYPGGRDLFSQAAPMCLTGNEFRRNSFIHSYKNSNRSLHFPLTGVESLSPNYWFIESACGSSRRAYCSRKWLISLTLREGTGFLEAPAIQIGARRVNPLHPVSATIRQILPAG
jgi:hypothetical protein